MSDLLGIGGDAVRAYQNALSTVSNNIANVNTEGYVRQENKLVENTPRNLASIYLGTGVRFDGIRRSYDEFLENNLRSSTSDLGTQKPMVDFANRVIDILGSDSVGLPPALDKFFESARILSTDPASSILRSQFLRDAESLAVRFKELSAQLTSVDEDTRELTNVTIESINNLSGQLALVNKQLAGQIKLSKQSPELLDQRDLLLKDLSQLVKIKVITSTNGSVDVSVSNSDKNGLIVIGQKSVDIGAKFSEEDLGSVAIVTDPFGTKPETVSNLSNGELGGIFSFREQLLEPTMNQLDDLAATFVEEINFIHSSGIDLRGEVGNNLFEINKINRVDSVTGDKIQLDRAAAGINISINDTAQIAAASLFRVIENDLNFSGADAKLTYSPSFANPISIPAISNVLKNNSDPSAGVIAPEEKIVGQIPIGSDNWEIYLDNATDNQQLQIFTRDGRHLIGGQLTDASEQMLLMTEENGFIKGSTYSSKYLNKSDIDGYKQISVFYGLKAEPMEQFDKEVVFTDDHNVLPSIRNRVEFNGENILADMTSIEANTLTLNGKSLPKLLPSTQSRTIQASDIASWLNKASEGMEPTLTINALTNANIEIADPTQGFFINGVEIPSDENRNEIQDLVNLLNDSFSSLTNVTVTLSGEDGEENQIILTNTIGHLGKDIRLGSMDIDGNIESEIIYKGRLNFSESGNVTIGYGSNGKLGALDVLGTPIGRYFTAVLPNVKTNAQIEGGRILTNIDSLEENKIKINDQSLGGLNLGRNLQASDFVTWVNNGLVNINPTRIIVAPDDFDFERQLDINGVTIRGNGPENFEDAEDIVDSINAKRLGVIASLDEDENIILVDEDGNDINIGPPVNREEGDPNALGIPGGNYSSIKAPVTSNDKIVTAFGKTEIEVSPLQYLSHIETQSLVINGSTISGSGEEGVFRDASDLVNAINSQPFVLEFENDDLDLDQPLQINGIYLRGFNGENGGNFESLNSVADRIMEEQPDIGVTAEEIDGRLIISSISDQDIEIGPSGFVNLFGMNSGTYSKVRAELRNTGTIRLYNDSGSNIDINSLSGNNALGIGNGPYTGKLFLDSSDEIRISFDETGTPADLARLGFRTSAYLDGSASEDLLVLVTGEGSGSIAGTFDSTMKNPINLNDERIKNLRQQDFEVTFTTDNNYQIIWKNPTNSFETVLAEREYDPEHGIVYRGLKLELDRSPMEGDKFKIDGNHDGIGNNQIMLEIVDLQNKRVIGGESGATIAEAYDEVIGKVGNFSNQATVAQKALEVVNDQAIEARDKVSGVTLDREAADLIRFQQAYQASAKVMQTANSIFDRILDL